MQQLSGLPDRAHPDPDRAGAGRAERSPRPRSSASPTTRAGGEARGVLNVQGSDWEVRLFAKAATATNQSTDLFALLSALVGFLFAFNAVLLSAPAAQAADRRPAPRGLRLPRGRSRCCSATRSAWRSPPAPSACCSAMSSRSTCSQRTPGYLSSAFALGPASASSAGDRRCWPPAAACGRARRGAQPSCGRSSPPTRSRRRPRPSRLAAAERPPCGGARRGRSGRKPRDSACGPGAGGLGDPRAGAGARWRFCRSRSPRPCGCCAASPRCCARCRRTSRSWSCAPDARARSRSPRPAGSRCSARARCRPRGEICSPAWTMPPATSTRSPRYGSRRPAHRACC